MDTITYRLHFYWAAEAYINCLPRHRVNASYIYRPAYWYFGGSAKSHRFRISLVSNNGTGEIAHLFCEIFHHSKEVSTWNFNQFSISLYGMKLWKKLLLKYRIFFCFAEIWWDMLAAAREKLERRHSWSTKLIFMYQFLFFQCCFLIWWGSLQYRLMTDSEFAFVSITLLY